MFLVTAMAPRAPAARMLLPAASAPRAGVPISVPVSVVCVPPDRRLCCHNPPLLRLCRLCCRRRRGGSGRSFALLRNAAAVFLVHLAREVEVCLPQRAVLLDMGGVVGQGGLLRVIERAQVGLLPVDLDTSCPLAAPAIRGAHVVSHTQVARWCPPAFIRR